MRCCAGIVLFNPEIERLKENISKIINQVDKVLLVDNGSKNIREIENLIRNQDRLELIKYTSNRGIAFALNEIKRFAELNNYKWFLTLDQDSVSEDNLIKQYEEFINKHEVSKVGCITCNIIDRNFSTSNKIVDFQYINYCITSGSFMNTSIIKEIGGFDESMFIDKVDTDICWNLIKHGYMIVRIEYVGLLHEIGHAKQISLGYRKWELYNHSAFRRYYMCRNSSYLLKKYSDLYVTKIFFKEIFQTLLVFCFECEKLKKLKKGLIGFVDGFRM